MRIRFPLMLEPDFHRQLRCVAFALDISLQAFVINSLQEALEKFNKDLEAANEVR